MSNKLSRILTIFLYVLMTVSVIIAILFYFGKKVPGTEGTLAEEPMITQTALFLAYIFVAIALITALIFPLIHIIQHPGNFKNALIMLLVFAGIIAIGYLLASSKPIEIISVDTTPATLRRVGAGLKATYILAALAFLGIIFSEVSSFFR
jgi:hypothetical protein